MYYLDSLRDKNGSEIYRTKAGFKYPLSKHRDGTYKVKSGEMLRVCMTSDFFLEAPFIGPVSIGKYLPSGQIEQVLCDGENYGGARPCHYEWVKSLSDECREFDVTFVFCGTGRRFVKDGKTYRIEGSLQSEQAYKAGLSYQGKPIDFKLTDDWGYPLDKSILYKPYYGDRCQTCGMRMTCNGCSRCGKCS